MPPNSEGPSTAGLVSTSASKSDSSFDLEEVDRLLSTTRSVRLRLDLERPVDPDLIVDCIRLANYAPNASNAQPWRWLVVDDPEKKALIAEIYREGMMAPVEALLIEREAQGDSAMVRHSKAILHLGRVLERVPALVIPCVEGRIEDDQSLGEITRIFASIYPAVWNFQLALRSRGLGSTFTTAHLLGESRARDLLGVPSNYTQACLIPVAHTLGGDFKRPARGPVEDVIGWNGWEGER